MLNWLLEEESGQGMVEYGLILVLVSIAAIVGLGAIGKALQKQFGTINNEHLKGPTKVPIPNEES